MLANSTENSSGIYGSAFASIVRLFDLFDYEIGIFVFDYKVGLFVVDLFCLFDLFVFKVDFYYISLNCNNESYYP